MIDWDAAQGWAITAVLMLALVGVVWWLRWRRDPLAFREGWMRVPSDWRQPADRFRPPS
jgi:hypothetical protein